MDKLTDESYYVYYYLRSSDSIHGKAGTPYYVGKGKGNRINGTHSVPVPADSKYKIKIAESLTDTHAKALEKIHISFWGRLDLNTGILRNRTGGGDGGLGRYYSEEECRNRSIQATTINSDPKVREKKRVGAIEALNRPEIKAKRLAASLKRRKNKADKKPKMTSEERSQLMTRIMNDPVVKNRVKSSAIAANSRPEVRERKRRASLKVWEDRKDKH
jgi:hypothetical protein